MANTKYYQKLVVDESPFMSNWMDDTNHIRTYLHDVEPQKMDNIVNMLFTQRQDFETPLLSSLEGKASSTMLLDKESDSWSWDFAKNIPPAIVLENKMAGATESTIGKDRSLVILKFDSERFTYGDVICCNRFQNKKLRVVPDGITREGAGWVYRMQLLSTTATDFYPAAFCEEGQEYIKLYSMYGEFNDQGSKVAHGGKMKMMNSLAGEIRTETAITDWADAMTITLSSVLVDASGKLVEVTDSKWFKRSEMAAWSEHRRMKENYLMFGSQANNLQSPSAYDVTSGMGCWDMLHLGNVNYFNQFSMKSLTEPIGDMYYGRVAGANRDVDLYTGEAGFNLFSDAVANKINGLGGLIPLDKFVTGSGMNMGFGYQFQAYSMPNGGTIRLKHLKTLDSWTTKSERGSGKYSRQSATFIGMDMSKDNRQNMKIVKRSTRAEDYWGYVVGTCGPDGPLKGGMSGTKKAGYEMWINSRIGLHIEDITKTFILKPTFEY